MNLEEEEDVESVRAKDPEEEEDVKSVRAKEALWRNDDLRKLPLVQLFCQLFGTVCISGGPLAELIPSNIICLLRSDCW